MGWNNPGPSRRVIIAGPAGEFFIYSSAPPRFGNLITAISAVAGTDPYGNVYDIGVTLLGDGANWSEVVFRRQSDTLRMGRIIADSNGDLIIEAGTDRPGLMRLVTPGGLGIQIGSNGPVGLPYSEQYGQSATANASGVSGAFTDFKQWITTAAVISDYPEPMNTTTGLWTCPVTGFYMIDCKLNGTAVSGLELAIRLFDNTTGQSWGQQLTAWNSTVFGPAQAKLTQLSFLNAGHDYKIQTSSSAASATNWSASTLTISRGIW